jgi:hypothetical protein
MNTKRGVRVVQIGQATATTVKNPYHPPPVQGGTGWYAIEWKTFSVLLVKA